MRLGSHIWLLAALLAVIPAVCGCSHPVAAPQSPLLWTRAYLSVLQSEGPTSSIVETPAVLPEDVTLAAFPPGVVVGQFTYDYSGKVPAGIRRNLQAELADDWPGGHLGPHMPRTAKGLAPLERFQFVPLYEIDASASVTSDLFAVSHRIPDSYICVLRVRGVMLTAFEWSKSGPWGQGWGSFDGPFFNQFPQAAKVLRAQFGKRRVRIRYLAAELGFWVVGRAGNEEKAVFVAAQGEPAFEDGKLYRTQEVIAGEPVAQ